MDNARLFSRPAGITIIFLVALIPFTRAGIGGQESFEKRGARIGLEFVTDIPLPGGTLRFDYQSIDEANRRLYISHMGANLVTVFDLNSRTVTKNMSEIPGPTGILAVPELNRVYISASRTNEVYVIDSNSLRVIAKVPTGRFPDGIAFDTREKRVFVSDEFGKSVTVFDAMTNRVIGNIRMGGEVGNTHYDTLSGLVYSTVQTAGELVAINPSALKIVARYKLWGCKGPHGFYIDARDGYAFVTGEDNASYVVFDLAKGRIIAHGRVGAGPDVLAFDSKSRDLYVASESGIVSAFHVGRRAITKIGEVYFAAHAHSVSVDEATRLVFFPLQDIGGRPVLRVMEPGR
jgi:YVTN family beta-propeller protein